jgi:serine/threonine-protein kinase
MTPERWRRITEVFHAARARDAAARGALLDEACAGDLALRAEVDAMLAADQGAGLFGEAPAFAPGEEGVPRFEPGAALGPYRIKGRIGAGGMGEVYRAHDPRLERDVAIKVLSAITLADPDARQRLLREARSAAALNHPHVCTVHEVGEVDGQAYIAMELIEGQPLDRVIPAGGLPVQQVLRYGLQIADAVAHAHACRIIHRDLKASNTLITPEGRAKVLDFGLAKRLSGGELVEARTQAPLTKPGMLAGTPAYMAPEQLLGQPADARSDVWALGVVLYEMVAGGQPFRGRTHFELSSAILREPPAPLPVHALPELAAVIGRCLEKEPPGRYADGGQVRTALEAIRTGGAVVPVVFPPPPARRRLAVLPLQNLSGDPEHDYFVEGTHDALITDLAGIGALRVIARSSVMRYKDREAPLPEIGDQLKVDIVLTGTVMRVGDRVRITAQLVDVSTEEHLWAGRYERGLADVLSLQSEIVASIARAIELQLTSGEQARLARRRPVNPEAYEACLKGRFHWYKVSREHWDTALEYFRAALEKDPSSALAHAGIAMTWVMRGDAGVVPAREAYPKLKAALSKAIELDDTLAEVHEISANARFLYEWDWPGAEREFLRAIQLNPNYADAHLFYSDFLIVMKRVEEARAEMSRALELDPLNSFLQCFLGWHSVYLRHNDDAIAQLRKVLQAEPVFSSAHLGLWGAFYRKGMSEEALEEARKFFAALGDTEVERSLEGGHDEDGYAGAMRRAAATLTERECRSYVPAIRIARLYAHASEEDRALEWLEKAYERRETPLIHLGVGWDWDCLRGDPRFEDLLRRMSLPR